MISSEYYNFYFFVFYVVIFFVSHSVSGTKNNVEEASRLGRAECRMWAAIENKTLPMQNNGHMRCMTNKNCTGFSCHGVFKEVAMNFGLRVISCSDEPGVEIFGSIPALQANNFSHIFTHGSTYDVPGSHLNISQLIDSRISLSNGSLDGLMIGRIEVHLKKSESKNSLIFGLSVQGCIQGGNCFFRRPVFNNTIIPVPKCQDTYSNVSDVPEPVSWPVKNKANAKVCNINGIFSCGPHQSCVQTDSTSYQGLCECLSGFSIELDGTCVPRDMGVKTGRSLNSEHFISSESSSAESNSSSYTTFVAVFVVLILFIGLVVGGVFLATRTRLLHRLRARVTNKPYEDMVVINGESNEAVEKRQRHSTAGSNCEV